MILPQASEDQGMERSGLVRMALIGTFLWLVGPQLGKIKCALVGGVVSLAEDFEVSKHWCHSQPAPPPAVGDSVTTRVSRVTIHMRPEETHVQCNSISGVGSKLLESDTGKCIVGVFSTVQFGGKFPGVIQAPVQKEA